MPALQDDIKYEVIKSSRKTMAIVLKYNGDIIVRTPLKCTQKYIHDFVMQKKEWIDSKRKNFIKYIPIEKKSNDTYVYIKGVAYKKIFQKGLRNHIVFEEDNIFIIHSGLSGKIFFEEYFQKQAIDYLSERFSIIAEHAKNIGLVTDKPLQFRKLRSRWGSCDSGGVITLNIHLFSVPQNMSDYVIKHELCHLKEMNHSPAFYRLLAQLDPYYKVHRQSLKYYGYNIG